MKIETTTGIQSAIVKFAPSNDGAFATCRCLPGQREQENQQEWAELGTIEGKAATVYYIFETTETNVEDGADIPFDAGHISYIEIEEDSDGDDGSSAIAEITTAQPEPTNEINTHTNKNGEKYYSKDDGNGETIYSFSGDFEETWSDELENLYGNTKMKIMNTSNNEIWNAAEIISEWEANGLIYKLLEVPRSAIDEDDDNGDPHLLIGLDTGAVRRLDLLLDTAYGREISDLDAVREAAETAPVEASEILNSFLG